MFTKEKILQAINLLPEYGLDVWILLARETAHIKDPALNLIYSGDVVWLSAFILGKNGENIAIVGKYDADPIIKSKEFDTVISYDEDFKKPFLDVLYKLNPEKIGLNFSLENPAADGLSYGLWLKLQDILKDTPFISRLTSAAPLIGKLRGIKTPAEIEKIRNSIRGAEEIISIVGKKIKPGLTEQDISQLFKKEMRKRNVIPAWSEAGCPAVSCGPESTVGHSYPSDEIVLKPGHLIHIDFGIIKDNYASDLQRVWYLVKDETEEVPQEIKSAFSTVRKAIMEAFQFIKPGVLGYEVDKIARDIVIQAGYPEYKHALGHEVGQKAHDGGIVLGPLWPKYEGTNDIPLKAGNVFTLELGVPTSYGYVGLEEIIVIEKDGAKFLSTPQKDIWVIKD